MKSNGCFRQGAGLSRVLTAVLSWVVWTGLAVGGALQAQVPARPVPPRLVNDLAGVFTVTQRQTLEWELVAFNDSTSNQIAVVTLPSFGGYAAADMAYEIGKRWGVGQAGFDNGIVVLIKPKRADEGGEVFIATGYGLEGAIPDAVCKRIIEDEMIPHFREDDYYGGTQAALKILKALASGEIKADNYLEDDAWLIVVAGLLLFAFLLFIVALVQAHKRNKDGFNGGGDGDGLGAAMGLLWLLSHSGNGSHGGSWGGFSGGGGFGGFGGGGFGGGGAGGRW